MSGRPPRGAGIVLGAILGPLVALAVAHNADQCDGVSVANVPQTVADAYLSAGWHGDPTDGEERLYPADCRTP